MKKEKGKKNAVVAGWEEIQQESSIRASSAICGSFFQSNVFPE